ncbi:MAG TPA: hypothetical protein VFJ77_04405 [Gaiellaceae bacterium]|nr:hypothetical protein [Gaiellaceae bacterium]
MERAIPEDDEPPFLCECGDVGCEKCVPMSPAEYEELPTGDGLALAPGHRLDSAAESGDGE